MSNSNGKFIITGEHSVVYGEPALVCELKKSLKVSLVEANKLYRSKYEKYIFEIFSKKFNKDVSKLKIIVASQLPSKSGLGSSAAFAHAIFKSLSKYYKINISKDEMFKLVMQAEVFIHKNSSGIDPYSVVYGGINFFQKDINLGEYLIKKIDLPISYDFLLINSGSATESTGEMVAKVSVLTKQNYKKKVINKMGNISREIIKQLSNGNFDGLLLDENHSELENLGVVGKKANEMIKKIKQVGAHVKITGAGGIETGSGWLLVFDDDLNKIIKLCKQNSWEYIKTKVK